MTLAKKTVYIINQASARNYLKMSHAVDYICSKYHEKREILENPEATHVVKAWIAERKRRLSQAP
jgi:hypothetical protein